MRGSQERKRQIFSIVVVLHKQQSMYTFKLQLLNIGYLISFCSLSPRISNQSTWQRVMTLLKLNGIAVSQNFDQVLYASNASLIRDLINTPVVNTWDGILEFLINKWTAEPASHRCCDDRYHAQSGRNRITLRDTFKFFNDVHGIRN